jgi:hypothetical protein
MGERKATMTEATVYGRVLYMEALKESWNHRTALAEAKRRLKTRLAAELGMAGYGAQIVWVEGIHERPAVDTSITVFATVRIQKPSGAFHPIEVNVVSYTEESDEDEGAPNREQA